MCRRDLATNEKRGLEEGKKKKKGKKVDVSHEHWML
jgi:hypothetical protein